MIVRRNTWRLTALLGLAIQLASGVGLGQASAEPRSDMPTYVGSDQCVECHQDASESWRLSHHALAWTEPAETSVLGDFGDSTFEHNGVRSRFFRDGGTFRIETDGPDGRLAVYDVVGVAGIAPLQQYLVEIEPGRVQALDTAWDAVQERWYHLYPDQTLRAGDGLHWTGPYKSWNARCAECHATGFEKAYDARQRRYRSRQAEIGVGCEACHGPASAHLDWAAGNAPQSTPGTGLSKAGLTVDFAAENAETEIQQCAGCHSRREPIGAESPLPGTSFFDAYRLALLRPGLYHPDGSINDEVYVYGSFLQSRMYREGVRCSDCHEPHSARLVADGNAVCTQCHSEAGNPRFPSLRKALYDDPEHHFHAEGTAGAACRSCHMIERVYMGIDGRRDHSFRVPRPDLTTDTGAPNACNDCHDDRDAEWAAQAIELWHPDSAHRGPHFSEVFAVGRVDPAGSETDLLKIATDPNAAGIVRATALELLRSVASEAVASGAAALLTDAEPLVRRTAVDLQRGAPACLSSRLLTSRRQVRHPGNGLSKPTWRAPS